jgi:hypothetical protein
MTRYQPGGLGRVSGFYISVGKRESARRLANGSQATRGTEYTEKFTSGAM